MNLSEWAKREIEIACERERGNKNRDEWDYGVACYESAYKAFQSLMEDGHSGLSIGFTKWILDRLIDAKPLTPIEDTPDIWKELSFRREGCTSYQCRRMSALFKDVYDDGTVKYHDSDRFYCIDKDEPDGFGWHNGFISNLLDDLYPITMPYSPATKPWYVYCSEGLFNPKNGDYDTMGIWYVLKPNGEKATIERFFKDSEQGFVEIDRKEFEERLRKA